MKKVYSPFRLTPLRSAAEAPASAFKDKLLVFLRIIEISSDSSSAKKIFGCDVFFGPRSIFAVKIPLDPQTTMLENAIQQSAAVLPAAFRAEMGDIDFPEYQLFDGTGLEIFGGKDGNRRKSGLSVDQFRTFWEHLQEALGMEFERSGQFVAEAA